MRALQMGLPAPLTDRCAFFAHRSVVYLQQLHRTAVLLLILLAHWQLIYAHCCAIEIPCNLLLCKKLKNF